MNPQTIAPAGKGKALPRAALILLVAAALWTRFWGLGWGLPYTYHVDEVNFAQRAARILETGNLNPGIFDVPTLHTYALAGMWRVYYEIGRAGGRFDSMADFLDELRTDATVFYLIGRALSALLGAATVLLVFAVGRRLYSRRIGALAAALFLVASDHVKMSHDMTPDVTMVFFLVLAFYFVVRAYQEGRLRDYLWTGFFAGIAMAVKYGGHMVLIPLFLAHCYRGWDRGKSFWAILFDPRLIGAGFAFLAAFILGCPYAALDFPSFAKGFLWQSAHLAKTGHFGSSMAQPALLFYLQFGFRESIGVLIQVLVLGSVARLAWLRRRADVLLLAFPVILFVLVGTWATRATRYILSAAPFFVLGGAVFLDAAAVRLAEWVSHLRRRKSTFAPGATAVAWSLAALLALPSAFRVVRFDLTIARPDTRDEAKEWIHRNIPKGAKIAFENYGPPFSRLIYASTYRHALGQIDMEWLSRLGIEYAVISDITYARFTRYPADFPREASFYADLDRNAVLLKTIAPRHDEPMLDLHNPTLKIYKLSAAPWYAFPGNYESTAVSFRVSASADGRWNIQAAWTSGREIGGGEKVLRRYLRLDDAAGRPVARLDFPPEDGPEGYAAASALIEAPADSVRAVLGTEFTWAPNPIPSRPEGRLVKEFVFPQRIDAAATRSKPFRGRFWYGQIPRPDGTAYFQSVTLVDKGVVSFLESRIFGSALRYADYRVSGPYLELAAGAEGEAARIKLADGPLGSEGGGRPGPWTTRKILYPASAAEEIVLGYETLRSVNPGIPGAAAAAVRLRLPPLDAPPAR